MAEVVDIVTVFEALFVLYIAVLPLTGIISLIRHQFWGHSEKSRWLGNRKYFWAYVILFAGMTAATMFTITARSIALIMAVGGDMTWANIGVHGSGASRQIWAVYACMGFISSVLFAIAARYAHVSGEDSTTVYSVMATWHLLTYVVSFLCFACELVCVALLSYGQYTVYNNTILFWFTFPFPVLFAGFLALILWNRAHPSTSAKV